MRHGIAVEREEWTGSDSSRPLTPEGRLKTREAARGLASYDTLPDLIVTSPKARAKQTAGIVREVWRRKLPLDVWDELAGDNVESWLTKLKTTKVRSVLLVGHEPDLTRFASLLLTGEAESVEIEWKKAGAIELALNTETGHATLQWMLPPRALRQLNARRKD